MKFYNVMIIIGFIGAVFAIIFLLATIHSSTMPEEVTSQNYQYVPVGDSNIIGQYTCTAYQAGVVIAARCTKIK